MLSRRQDLALAAAEAAALLAFAVLPVPMAPAMLLVVASAALWARGASFAGPPGAGPTPALIGIAVGAASLLAAVAIAGPVLAGVMGTAIEWNREPAARGSLQGAVAVVVLAAAGAVAAELAFRGWVAARVATLWPRGGDLGAVVVAAVAEAAVLGGSIGERAGVFAVACGLGALWAGSGRRLAAGMACRLVFEIGAVVLVALGAIA